eukprot:TRINITY_DN446_c0_g2_i3.p1 TRINITY_DN446_c0_g2~~TRINITY_DN446_c0_g2_i3.p1  ORF type:complete len:392 (+),score=63.85 TRINITY_DN446_c0_g2_i3:388-1563(+)
MSHIELRLTRIELPTKAIYEAKLAELELFQRYCTHAHIHTVLTHWDIPVDDVYAVDKGVYRKIAILSRPYQSTLFEHTIKSGTPIPPGRALRLFGEIAKALNILHAVNVVHAGVTIDTIILDDHANATLGLPRKVDTDTLRQHLSSNPALEDAVAPIISTWAPEITSNYGEYYAAVDVWALAVTFYTIVTGDPPFDDIVRPSKPQNINWSKLDDHKHLRYCLENMLILNISKRWDIATVHNYCQNYFAGEVQRVYRGHAETLHWSRVRLAVLRIQKVVRGRLARLRVERIRRGEPVDGGMVLDADDAASGSATVSASASWRNYAREVIDEETRAVLMLQANVLCRQYSRAFAQYRAQVVKCQGHVRRMLAKRWFQSVLAHRTKLEDQLEGM